MKEILTKNLSLEFNKKELLAMSDRLDAMIYYYFYLDNKIQEPLYNLILCVEEAIAQRVSLEICQ